MALRDLFKRGKSADLDNPVGMGDDDGENEAGEGGPSIFKQEMAELRWAAQQEAVNIGRRGVDPERWEDGRMAFEFERALAHGHEGLRERLANFVGRRVRDEARELYSLAGDVALARDELREIDQRLVEVTRDWRTKRAEVTDDELELSRYYRLRSAAGNYVKYGIAILFVISEFIISGLVFERIFEDLPPGLGYVLALGVTVALIVIPHYTALGLKEGLTQYHVFEKRALERDGKPIPMDVERAVHVEERDDKGFRITAFLLGAGLLVLILPLSWIRATAENGGEVNWPAFFFLLLLQLVLSGYFFLREWLDHGHPSHGLHKLGEEKEAIAAERRATLEWVSDAVAEFHDTAEDLIFTLQQAPRWDSHIVDTYYETIHYYRSLITLEQPEYEEFITWARVPYLGSKTTKDDSDYPLDPVSEEHRTLEEGGPMGREWLLRTAAEALAGIKDEPEDDATDDPKAAPEASWLVTKSPDLLLAEYLRRYFDLDVEYKRPTGLDLPPDDEPDEPPAEDRTGGDEDDLSGEPDGPSSDKRLQVVTSDDDGASGAQPSQGGTP